MAEVVITLKLNADEFQTLREELQAHQGHLRAMARDDFCRILVVHTERGRIERQLLRGESWEHALAELEKLG